MIDNKIKLCQNNPMNKEQENFYDEHSQEILENVCNECSDLIEMKYTDDAYGANKTYSEYNCPFDNEEFKCEHIIEFVNQELSRGE